MTASQQFQPWPLGRTTDRVPLTTSGQRVGQKLETEINNRLMIILVKSYKSACVVICIILSCWGRALQLVASSRAQGKSKLGRERRLPSIVDLNLLTPRLEVVREHIAWIDLLHGGRNGLRAWFMVKSYSSVVVFVYQMAESPSAP